MFAFCLRRAFFAAVFAFSVVAFDGGRPFLRFWRCLRFAAGGRFFAAFCGWRRACVRCGRFFAGVFACFCVFLCLAAGGRAMRVFFSVCVWRRAAVLAAVCGGRPFFAAFCSLRRAAVFLRRFAVAGGRALFAVLRF